MFDVAGFLLALLAMVLFGLYMVPRKLSALRDFEFLLTMCLGALATAWVAHAIAHVGPGPAISSRGAWLAFSCGPVWSLGMLFYTLSVTEMGLTLATPIKNTTAVIGTVLGLALFAEWRSTQPAPALIGSVLVVGCAVALARTGERNGERSFVTALGVLYAVLAALFFAAYTIPLKLAQAEGVDNYSLITRMGVGILAGGLCLFMIFSRDRRRWLRQPLRCHLFAALAGATWALATVAMTEAIARIGLAITWPITNLNTLVTVACGIMLYKEVNLRKYSGVIGAAMLLAVAGTVLLGLARR